MPIVFITFKEKISSVTIELAIATRDDGSSWNQVVQSSSHGNIFHSWEWLTTLSKFSEARFLPVIARKGNTILAVYPLFILKKGVFNIALSPPPRGVLNYLGPVFNGYDALRLDKKESLFLDVQRSVDKYLQDSLQCSLIRIRSSPGLMDPRPFRWCGYQLEPFFTYRISLAGGSDGVWAGFDKKLRYDINKAEKEGVIVEQGDINDLQFILDRVSDRFIEQGINPSDHFKYISDLYKDFYPKNLKIFVAKYRGEKISGMICPCFKNILYLWLGIPKINMPGVSPNDLLQWEAIKWASSQGLDYFENIDAGIDIRLKNFKSKYNPYLVPWYSAMKYTSSLYRLGGDIISYVRGTPIH